MKPSKSLCLVCAMTGLVLAACASGEHARSASPDAVAAGLACTELAQGGAARPFADGAPGVVRTSLRAGSTGSDPLLVDDARISVNTVAGRYLVDVTSTDRETAREVLSAAGL